jgi:hypothetical protein
LAVIQNFSGYNRAATRYTSRTTVSATTMTVVRSMALPEPLARVNIGQRGGKKDESEDDH